MLFVDHDLAAVVAERASPMDKAKISAAANRKASDRQLDVGDVHSVHSFRALRGDAARFGD
jgi:hypothetical protein